MRGARMLKRGRKWAASRMDALCEVTRTTKGELDPTTGTSAKSTTLVYSGVGRIKQASAVGRKVDGAGLLAVIGTPELRVPWDTVGIRPGDDITVTACESRPALVGRAFKIREQFDGAQTTDLRYRIEVADVR